MYLYQSLEELFHSFHNHSPNWYTICNAIYATIKGSNITNIHNAPNPINPGLENFGSDLSIICKTHYTPVDKVQIEKGRINGW